MRYCFVTDKDSDYSNHIDKISWYLIPLNLYNRFYFSLTQYGLDFITREEFEKDFNQYIMEYDIENYSFENPQKMI